MYEFDAVPLRYESRRAVEASISGILEEPEMTAFESAFLCGLLEQEKPHKIVEIGVAAGGSTMVMLKCLESIGELYRMFSVDVSERYYRWDDKKTGFMAKDTSESLKFGHHEFLLGSVIPAHLEYIGRDIDFVLLDGRHELPGELLDFICLLPFLKVGAVVCLHDTMLNQYLNNGSSYIATNVLMHTVKAVKIINFLHEDTDKGFLLPNIAAFRITEETYKDVLDVFLALTMNWAYVPDCQSQDFYSRCIHAHYDTQLFRIYDEALKINLLHMHYIPWSLIPFNANIILYGAGEMGQSFYLQIMKSKRCHLIKWVDRNYSTIKEIFGQVVEAPETIQETDADVVLIAVAAGGMAVGISESLVKMGIPMNKIIWQGQAVWEF